MKNLKISIKLLGGICILLILACGGMGFIGYYSASSALEKNIHEALPTMAEDSAKLIRSTLDFHLMAIESVAFRESIRSMDWNQQLPVLTEELERLDYLGIGVVTPDGEARYSDGSTASLGDRNYVQRAFQGRTNMSDVIISRVTNEPVIMLASPIKSGNRTVGVLIARVDGGFLSRITDEISYGGQGYSYIVNQRGTVIAHPNRDFVNDQRNFIEEARNNPEFSGVSRVLQRMIRNGTGFDQYRFNNNDYMFGFAPVQDTGWSFAVGARSDEIFAEVRAMRINFILFSLLFLGIGVALAMVLARSVTVPVRQLMESSVAISKGDLDSDSGIKQRDEIGILADAIRTMVGKLVTKMQEAEEQTNLAKQESERARLATDEANLAKEKAETAKRDGMLQAASQLEGIVSRVSSASEELSAQVEQSSRGAEEQKNRTTETATAMEEMNATVLEVAKNASSAAGGADKARQDAQEGARIVSDSIQAIRQVQETSESVKQSLDNLGVQAEEITSIMNVIDDIADQTNLLALNAAIEAARAGDAGRGFAVVADEVRKLAEKTMNATKEVGQAITSIQDGAKTNIQGMDKAVAAVEQATELANRSGQALQGIVDLAEEVADQVRSIATATEEQSSASEEVNRSIEDINRIAAETADVMEQSSKAISELAQQAGELQNLIQELKNTR
ncbi:methyl-accepting chemotaxis protein [Desulfonatronovibrio hydrogenovorans]|uniref:methyl-accepting chemotaxis protein n=1 Tax=Desulfonatronovibrio hydrogenovorans TaxID=53245 RepID=UPI00048BC025|nr:methyl-accepting chemotaxis protein [Desulfonatronovibrio hydrogenovorans]